MTDAEVAELFNFARLGHELGRGDVLRLFATLEARKAAIKAANDVRAERDARLLELEGMLNSAHTADFLEAAKLEAIHQRERWGAEHDAGKEPQDWFWLLGYLAGKALKSAITGDIEKALHHTISSAAALLNWHAHLTGESTRMRPGIQPPREPTPVDRYEADLAENAIGVGFSVACGLFARGREDVMRMIDRNDAFSSACANMIAQSWLSDATQNKSKQELSASFAALLDGLIAKADATKQGASS